MAVASEAAKKTKTIRLTDFDDIKDAVIHYSTIRRKKPASFKVAESENALLSSFL